MRGDADRGRDRRCTWTGLFACLGLAAGFAGLAFPAAAQSVGTESDRTYLYANSGVALPTNVPNYGQDEVQASGGVACRSSVGGGGAYLDAGVVESEDRFSRSTTAAYARVVVPLGRRPKRIDCSALYELEIERLRLELEMARMSLPQAHQDTVPTAVRATLAFAPTQPPAS